MRKSIPDEIKEFVRSKVKEGLTYGKIGAAVEEKYKGKITRQYTNALIGRFRRELNGLNMHDDAPAYHLTERGKGIIDGKEPYLRSMTQMDVLAELYEKPMNAYDLRKKLGHRWGKIPHAIKCSEKAGLISTDGMVCDIEEDKMIRRILPDGDEEEIWIYKFILNNPGATKIEIKNKFAGYYGVNDFEICLRNIEKDGFVSSTERCKGCYYVTDDDVAVKILLAMKKSPAANQKEIAEAAGVAPSTVTYHLKKEPEPIKAPENIKKGPRLPANIKEALYLDAFVAVTKEPGITADELSRKLDVSVTHAKIIMRGLAERGCIKTKNMPHYYAIDREKDDSEGKNGT